MTTLLTNLVNYWKFNETSGDAIDSVGANTLTDNGGVGSRAGKINNARAFDPTSNQFFTGTSLGSGDLTISFWFNGDVIAPFSQYQSLFACIKNSGDSISIGAASTGIVYTLVRFGVENTQITVNTTITAGNWYHVVARRDTIGKVTYLTVNGSLTPFLPGNYTITYNDSGNQLQIGGTDTTALYGAANYFDGLIDEVSVWSRVLSDSEITTLYNSGNGLSLEAYGSLASQIDGRSSLNGFLSINSNIKTLIGSFGSISTIAGDIGVVSMIPGTRRDGTDSSRYLITSTNVNLNWNVNDKTNNDINLTQPKYTIPRTAIDESWYNSVSIPPVSTITLDLTSLPVRLFGLYFVRGFSKIKSLTIENTNNDARLYVGTSGVSNSISEFGYQTEIGFSGIAQSISYIGFNVDSTHKNLGITNFTMNPVTCKVLILGVIA